MNGYGKRLLGVLTLSGLFVLGAVLFILLYLSNQPPAASAVSTPSGPHLYISTVAAAELSDSHPTWVSYYSVDANDQHWRHATTYVVPANTVVNVTIWQFDSQT